MNKDLITAIKKYRVRKNLSEDFDTNDITVLADFVEHSILFQLSQFMLNQRKKVNLSIRELNRRSHVSIAVINDLENAKSMPRLETLIRLALALKVDFNDVLLAMSVPFQAQEDVQYIPPKMQTVKYEPDISACLSSHGYRIRQINEILDFISYVDYKSKIDNDD